mgnify:CR=1 FL=1
MRYPRISVIIPTYNGDTWIAETIESVIKQTFQDFEIIVVDDGSPTPVARFLDFDPRIHIVRQENAGTSAARNLALTNAKGEFVAFLDHDDLWTPEKLQRQVDLFSNHPEIGFVFCDYESFGSEALRPNGFLRGTLNKVAAVEVDPEVFLIKESNLFKWLLKDLFVQIPSTWMIRRQLLLDSGGFNPALRRGTEDWHLALRLSERCHFAFHRRTMVKRREFPQSLSATSNSDEEMLRALNLLCNTEELSPGSHQIAFEMRREFARNLARLDFKAGHYKESREKISIALERCALSNPATWKDIYISLRSLAKT